MFLHFFSRLKTRNKPACAQVAELAKPQSQCCTDAASGCECSDDELITKFRAEYFDHNSASTADRDGKTSRTSATESSSGSTKTGSGPETPLKDEIVESSDVSSFEDLGAVGGTHNTPHPNETDKWQMIDGSQANAVDETASSSSLVTDDKMTEAPMDLTSNTTNLPNSINETQPPANASIQSVPTTPAGQATQLDEAFRSHSNAQRNATIKAKLEKSLKTSRKKIVRRQSDGIVYTHKASTSGAASDRATHAKGDAHEHKTGDGNNVNDDLESNTSSSSSSSSSRSSSYSTTWPSLERTSCHKCGKRKGDLKRHIARFRHQLETTTNFGEVEIKRQLNAFLEFLENHSRNSFDSKDDETMLQCDDEIDPGIHDANIEFDELEIDEFDDDIEDGIHVTIQNLPTHTLIISQYSANTDKSLTICKY